MAGRKRQQGRRRIMVVREPRRCVYCGHEAHRAKKGEHVVAEALGGALTISDVCQARTACIPCNTGVLSDLDRELCSRSHLSVVASQEIGSHLWKLFDVDHAAQNLLLEAKPDWNAKSVVQYGQMVFEPSGPQLRGDLEEIEQFGRDAFKRVFERGMLRAFRQYDARKNRWIHFERIDKHLMIGRGYRYPPRLLTRLPIHELAEKLSRGKRASFVLRYTSASDARLALNELNKWRPGDVYPKHETGVGSSLPEVRSFSDPERVLRALMKLGLNLIAAYCPNTPVTPDSFQHVVPVIMGQAAVRPLLGSNGFVCASDIQPIRDIDGGHSFRLVQTGGVWEVYSSFFGGRIGAVVRLPGPNEEDWCCADIVAPIRSKQWSVRTGRLVQPLTVRVEWEDPAKIMPSVEMLNVRTAIRVVRESPGRDG